jgi:hypothetical protein
MGGERVKGCGWISSQGNSILEAIQNRTERVSARFSSYLEFYPENFLFFTLQIESNCYDLTRKVAILKNEASRAAGGARPLSRFKKSIIGTTAILTFGRTDGVQAG